MKRKQQLLLIGAIAAAGAALLWFLQPVPVAVDVGPVTRGAVHQFIAEDGEARAHDRYVVAAPVAGRLTRIDLHEGDAVAAGQTVAWLAPVPLTAAELEQAQARLVAAQAQVREAEAGVARAANNRVQAQRERLRAEQLVAERFVSGQALEQARLGEQTAQAEVRAASERQRAALAEVDHARAVLHATRGSAEPLALAAPVSASVLRIVEKSERVLAQGSPILVLGNPEQIELVVDLLSSDAVRVKPGMAVEVSGWGGAPLGAKVRTVEPAAFTKVSALGVEEQRVNVVADFDRPPPGLGDAYRVEARILVDQRPAVLVVPLAALFRAGDGWRVFVVERQRAVERDVRLGLRGAEGVEVLAGLAEDERVVLYPGNSLRAGAKLKLRSQP